MKAGALAQEAWMTGSSMVEVGSAGCRAPDLCARAALNGCRCWPTVIPASGPAVCCRAVAGLKNLHIAALLRNQLDALAEALPRSIRLGRVMITGRCAVCQRCSIQQNLPLEWLMGERISPMRIESRPACRHCPVLERSPPLLTVCMPNAASVHGGSWNKRLAGPCCPLICSRGIARAGQGADGSAMRRSSPFW